jgi:hypothetical protein
VLLRPGAPGAGEKAPRGVQAHVVDADGFREAYGLAPEGACLMRPDGIVGWRSNRAFADDDVSRALDAILWPKP